MTRYAISEALYSLANLTDVFERVLNFTTSDGVGFTLDWFSPQMLISFTFG